VPALPKALESGQPPEKVQHPSDVLGHANTAVRGVQLASAEADAH